MPLAIIFISIIAMLSFVGVIEGYMIVKIDQSSASASFAQSEMDNSIETVRRNISKQIASHTEVSDVADPGAWQVERKICEESGSQCNVIVRNVANFNVDHDLSTPAPSDTPIPCSADVNDGMHECNLSLGGELDEVRKVVRIRTVIETLDGRQFASADRLVRYRMFRLYPYVQVVGVRDPVSASSIKSVGDSGGFDSPGGAAKDTLLRSYAPCRNIPQSAPTPISDNNYNWGEWTNSGPAPAIQVECKPNSGDTSHFQSGSSSDSGEVNSWGETR